MPLLSGQFVLWSRPPPEHYTLFCPGNPTFKIIFPSFDLFFITCINFEIVVLIVYLVHRNCTVCVYLHNYISYLDFFVIFWIFHWGLSCRFIIFLVFDVLIVSLTFSVCSICWVNISCRPFTLLAKRTIPLANLKWFILPPMKF